MSSTAPATPVSVHAAPGASTWLLRFAPGLIVSAIVAAAGVGLARQPWMQSHGLSALTLAIIIGMVAGNTVYPRIAQSCGAGVGFSKQWLLRTGVVLYGLRLTGQDIGNVGVSGVVIDALIVVSTFLMAAYLGTRWLGIDRRTALLIAAGNSICGAAAVMAAEPVVKGKAEQVAIAIATVVTFGTVAIFVYPALYELNLSLNWIPGGMHGFGVYIGSSVHEVAQVIAAARPVGVEAGDTAVIAKMVRVMMLAPMLLSLSWWLSREARKGHSGETGHDAKISIPWFALAFIGAVAFNSMHLLPTALVGALNDIDADLLATAMAALGLSTHASAVRKAGMKPLILAGILFVWLIVGGAAINHWVPVLFA